MNTAMLRPALAGIIAFVFVLIQGPAAIRYLHKLKFGQNVRTDGPRRHLEKSGTPTMGGIIIMVAFALSVLMFNHRGTNILFGLFTALAYAAVGFLDDLLKTLSHSPLGLKARHKLLAQFLVALMLGLYAVNNTQALGTELLLPFTGTYLEFPPLIYLALTVLALVGSANAVNLTDGVDGLAAGTMAVTALIYAVIAYFLGYPEITLLAAGLSGACLGFLWFNSHPAQIFMGDTGSLALGAALGAMAVLTKTTLCLPLVAGLYVLEALSVIGQVTYFKITKGRRLLRMAPLHHHLELGGWQEPQVTARLGLVSIIFGLLGLFAVL